MTEAGPGPDPAPAVDPDLVAQLRRGASLGRPMSGSTRALLERIVMAGAEAEGTARLRRSWCPFRRAADRRRVDRLVAMRLVRRDGNTLRPTVAGVGAVVPFHRAITDTSWLRRFAPLDSDTAKRDGVT